MTKSQMAVADDVEVETPAGLASDTTTTVEPEVTPEVAPPKELDLGLDDATRLSSEAQESLRSFAKDHALSDDVAQAMAKVQSEAADAFESKQAAELGEVQKMWASECEKEWPDTTEREAVALRIKKVITENGDDGFYKTLAESGYLDEPNFCRLINAIGKKLDEPKSVIQATPSPVAARNLTAREKYAKDFPNSPYPGD